MDFIGNQANCRANLKENRELCLIARLFYISSHIEKPNHYNEKDHRLPMFLLSVFVCFTLASHDFQISG